MVLPDFVALDFATREVVVVEVASGADIKKIVANVKARERQWFGPLRDKLKADDVVDGWDLRFLGFVRRHNLKTARRLTEGQLGVAFWALEDATFSWDYWADRIGEGLPR